MNQKAVHFLYDINIFMICNVVLEVLQTNISDFLAIEMTSFLIDTKFVSKFNSNNGLV